MDLSLRTLAALLALVAAASCAPPASYAPPAPCARDAWAKVRNSSLQLNGIAKSVSVEVRNGSKDIDDISIEAAWIGPEDECDPETLRTRPETCLRKILSVSRSYSSDLDTVSKFRSCREHAEKVIPAVKQLQRDLQSCVEPSVPPSQPVVQQTPVLEWEESSTCLYTLERLFSFSILTARVLAVGDPSHHTASQAARCRRAAAAE